MDSSSKGKQQYISKSYKSSNYQFGYPFESNNYNTASVYGYFRPPRLQRQSLKWRKDYHFKMGYRSRHPYKKNDVPNRKTNKTAEDMEEEERKKKLNDTAKKLLSKLETWNAEKNISEEPIKSKEDSQESVNIISECNSRHNEEKVSGESKKRIAHSKKPKLVKNRTPKKLRQTPKTAPKYDVNKATVKDFQNRIQHKLIEKIMQMPKENLQNVLNDPKINPAMELKMSRLVQENRPLITQRLRALAESKMEALGFTSSQLLDNIDKLIDPVVETDLSALPYELIKQMENLFQVQFDYTQSNSEACQVGTDICDSAEGNRDQEMAEINSLETNDKLQNNLFKEDLSLYECSTDEDEEISANSSAASSGGHHLSSVEGLNNLHHNSSAASNGGHHLSSVEGLNNLHYIQEASEVEKGEDEEINASSSAASNGGHHLSSIESLNNLHYIQDASEVEKDEDYDNKSMIRKLAKDVQPSADYNGELCEEDEDYNNKCMIRKLAEDVQPSADYNGELCEEDEDYNNKCMIRKLAEDVQPSADYNGELRALQAVINRPEIFLSKEIQTTSLEKNSTGGIKTASENVPEDIIETAKSSSKTFTPGWCQTDGSCCTDASTQTSSPSEEPRVLYGVALPKQSTDNNTAFLLEEVNAIQNLTNKLNERRLMIFLELARINPLGNFICDSKTKANFSETLSNGSIYLVEALENFFKGHSRKNFENFGVSPNNRRWRSSNKWVSKSRSRNREER